MKITPRGNRVLLTQIDMEAKTESGIYLPSSGNNENVGLVISAGPKVEGLREGDKVIFTKFAGTEIKDGSKKYLLIEEKEILGTFE